jgi:DNA-binding NarL/FixJ family response regulator
MLMTAAVKSVTVLVADDQRFLRTAVQRALGLVDSKAMNIRCLFARDHAEIMSHLDGSTATDVLITNRLVGDASGLDVLKSIRSGLTGVPGTMPVLLVIGYGDPELVRLARALDVNAILVRPISLRLLIDRIRHAMLHPIEPGDVARYHDVRLPQALAEAPDVRRSPRVVLDKTLRPTQVHGGTDANSRKRTLWVRVENLRAGMTVAQDVRGPTGSLVVGHGVPLTPRLVSRLNELVTRLPQMSAIKIYGDASASRDKSPES